MIDEKTAAWRTELNPRLAGAIWGSLLFVALVFIGRGLAGAYVQHLSTLAACCASSLAALLSVTALGLARSGGGSLSSTQFARLFAITVLPPTVLGIVLAPASVFAIAWVTMLAVGLGVCVNVAAEPVLLTAWMVRRTNVSPPMETFPPDSQLEPNVTQWMSRKTVTEAGETWETMEGQLTAAFAAGQRQTTLHLSICPPMATEPDIECETLNDPQVEWKVAAKHPYGIRLEVRRPAPAAEPLSVAIGYTVAAVLPKPLRHAA